MSGNIERFEKAMSQGHNAAWDQLWDQAVEFYRQALAEIPDDPKALTSLALALYETQRYDEALQVYHKVSQQTPTDPIPHERVAELYEKMNQPERAVEFYLRSAELHLKTRDVNRALELWRRVIQINPDHLVARSRLALVYERLGRKTEALSEYLAVASLLQHAGEVQKAIQAASRALNINPNSAEAQQALALIKAGRLLPKPGRPRPAGAGQAVSKPRTGELTAGESEQQPDPIGEATQKALAALAALMFDQDESAAPVSARRGMSDLVRGAFEAISGQADRNRILLHLSQVIELQTQRQTEAAAEELQRAIDLGLKHPAAYFDLGSLQVTLAKYKPGIENLARAAGHPDYALAAHLQCGKAWYELKDYRAAAVECLEALKRAEMSVLSGEQAQYLEQMYDPLIEAQTQAGDGGGWAALCESIFALLIRPNWRVYLAEARRQIPEQDAAQPTPLAEILTAAGSNAVVDALASIRRLLRSGKTRAAMEDAYAALHMAPLYLPLHILIGDILLQQGQFQAALEKFAMAARNYEARGELHRAILLYRRIADLSPMDAQARSNLIGLMIRNGQNESAIEEYLELSEMYYNLADLENARRTMNEALLLAQQTNASRELKFKVLGRLADIEMQSLNWRQAVSAYEQMRSLQPQDEAVRLALIELYFRLSQAKRAGAEISDYVNLLARRKEADRAGAFLDQLAEQYPQQPVVMRQQAEFFRQLGRKEEAIQKLDAAGELYLQIGDRNAAAETIMAILALNPPNAAQYQQLLAQIRGG